MGVQVGPASRRHMRRWLVTAGALELFDAGLFTGLTLLARTGPLATAAAGVLDVVLVLGGLSWLLAARGFFTRASPRLRTMALAAAYGIAVAALLAFWPALALRGGPVGRGEAALAGVWYALALGEFVHYFLWKVNMRGRELRRVLRTRRPLPARLRRELRAARLAHR